MKKVLAILVAVAAMVLTGLALSAPASAHEALPQGVSVCGTDSWSVDGTTNVVNTSGTYWTVTFTSSAGTIVGGTSGKGDTTAGPSYTITDIPVTIASVTVTTTLKWGTTSTIVEGKSFRDVTVTRPDGGCLAVVVPTTPTPTPTVTPSPTLTTIAPTHVIGNPVPPLITSTPRVIKHTVSFSGSAPVPSVTTSLLPPVSSTRPVLKPYVSATPRVEPTIPKPVLLASTGSTSEFLTELAVALLIIGAVMVGTVWYYGRTRKH